MRFKSIWITVSAIATAVLFAVGYGGAAESPTPNPVSVEPQQTRLAGAVVVARPPSISEILDIILGDRDPVTSAVVSKSGAAGGSEQARIARVLETRTHDEARANRIATALVREGKRANIGSTLLVGVLLTENPDLEPRATSSVGARGLMQVMPLHAGKWGCESSDLFDIEANICHAVRILADDLRHSPDLPAALLRYNGCVRGTNTPDCYRYAGKVYGYARRSAAGPEAKITSTTPFSPLNPFRFSARRPNRSQRASIVLPRELLVD